MKWDDKEQSELCKKKYNNIKKLVIFILAENQRLKRKLCETTEKLKNMTPEQKKIIMEQRIEEIQININHWIAFKDEIEEEMFMLFHMKENLLELMISEEEEGKEE